MKRMTMRVSAVVFAAGYPGYGNRGRHRPCFHQRRFSRSPPEGGAAYSEGFGANAGIDLPDSGVPNFAFGFTLPFTYTPGNTVYVGVFWHTDAATPCTAMLRPNFLSVARYGDSYIQGGNASSGLVSSDGSTDLQPLDVINLGFFRPAESADDTCTGDVTIQGLAIATE